MTLTESPANGACWPVQDLEAVENCPFCHSTERTLAYSAVEDWTFHCAPGKWDYWKCQNCGALYLDPRPTEAAIGRAYARYYTHGSAATSAPIEKLKTLLRHACYHTWYGLDLQPRLALPGLLRPLLSPLRRRMAVPFVYLELARLPRGRLMDVGCGNGSVLRVARQLGWDVEGLEIDPRAVEAARAAGLSVMQGDYRCLEAFVESFDCVICFHVIEHVHSPLELLRAIHAAIKPGGTALIILPNADSLVLELAGENWRGLEAPRHLSIPTANRMRYLCERLGFTVKAMPVAPWVTLKESLAIARQRGYDLRPSAKRWRRRHAIVAEERSDFINLVLKKDNP